MIDFIMWLYSSFSEFIAELSNMTVGLISNSFESFFSGSSSLNAITVNLVLFSDTPIFSVNMYDLLLLIFSIFYTVIFITIVWKIIKKVIVKVTGWNRW